MLNKTMKSLLAMSLLVVVMLVAGCGGSDSGIQRIAGLSAEGTVRTFIDAAKNNRMNEAALYVSAASKTDAQTVLKFMTGQTGVEQIKKSNLLSVNEIAEQGNYAAYIVTMQEENSIKITIKPVGLEKVNDEWYIVDRDQILTNIKYQVLQQLTANL